MAESFDSRVRRREWKSPASHNTHTSDGVPVWSSV